MRKYLILFALCVFFIAVSYYLVTTLNPFNEEQIAQLVRSENIKVSEEFQEVVTELIDKGLILEFLDVRNVLLLGTTVTLAVLSGFMFVHTVIDKLFFRKFYEQPSLLLAFRRGVLVCLALVSIFIYRLFAAEWYLTVLTIGLLIIIEVMIGRMAPEPEPEVLEAAGEDPESAIIAVSPNKFKLRLKPPTLNPKKWVFNFRETVMRQVAESEAAFGEGEEE